MPKLRLSINLAFPAGLALALLLHPPGPAVAQDAAADVWRPPEPAAAARRGAATRDGAPPGGHQRQGRNSRAGRGVATRDGAPPVRGGRTRAHAAETPEPPARPAGRGRTRAHAAENAGPGRGATRWPGFRGGRDTNVSRAARLPLTWSDDSVAWRVTTPGFGQSSPVIWDGTVFLTSLAGARKETLFVTALGLDDGGERWRRTFDAAEAFEWNDYVSKGAPTPAVDAERLYAFFDSGDLLALTHDGETVWRRRLGAEYGTVGGNHGVGNSVLLTGDAVVVLLTRRTYSYLLAADPATGETLWKADREPGVAWSTPVLAPAGGEIVVSAAGRIEGFDPATGARLWFFEDLRGNHVPSPTITADLVIVGGLSVGANLALRRGRTGALDRTDVAWTAGSASNFASPFVYRGCAYWVNPAGAARCLAPESGAVRWTHRLPASAWATPLGHGGRVYFFTQDGVTQVLRASAEAPEVLATNVLSVDAPVTGFAAVDDAIVIRAGSEAIRVGRPVAGPAQPSGIGHGGIRPPR